jgi:hypothetical protein
LIVWAGIASPPAGPGTKELKMAEDRAPYHTLEDDPDLVRPHEPSPRKQPSPRKRTGKGGTRHGFVSKNEIEDMGIFDEDPGKAPTEDEIHDPKSFDDNGFRDRK